MLRLSLSLEIPSNNYTKYKGRGVHLFITREDDYEISKHDNRGSDWKWYNDTNSSADVFINIF